MRAVVSNRAVGVGLIVAAIVGSAGWLWWRACRQGQIYFLPRQAPAEWIVYPANFRGMGPAKLELSTHFARSLRLDRVPSTAWLRVAGFGQYKVFINGKEPLSPKVRATTWKHPDQFDAAGLLSLGDNRIEVMVTNAFAVPALWFSLALDGTLLNSDTTWQASCEGAAERPARLARIVPTRIAGDPLDGPERPWTSLRACWVGLILLLILSAGLCWLGNRWALARVSRAWFAEHLPLLLAAVFWVILFANNLGALPAQIGFDAGSHLEYILHFQEHWSLPAEAIGWEKYQAPLYYLLGAVWVDVAGIFAIDVNAIYALRLMGLVIGIGHLTLIWMSLRLIFPGDRTKQLWSLLLAGFLPALVYTSHYVTNEALCAALVSLSLYLCLRVLSQERPSWALCAGLGVSLGLALLTKITAAVALAAVTAGLLWKVTEQRANKRMLWPSLARLLVMCAVCGLVCGWYYVRNRVKFGSWLGFFWIPDSSMNVWRDANYGTFGFYAKFGSVLVEPWFAGRQSLFDGLYSTLWGDGLFGGAVDGSFRPPWNYDLSAVAYWLALLPSFAVLLGFALALRRCWRRPSAEWVVLLSLMFAMMFALIDRSLVTPGFSNAKAFYGLAALLPFCALGGLGLEALSFRSRLVKTVLSVLFGLWALSSGATFWINRSSEGAVLCKARSLSAEGRYENALQLLRGQLEATPRATRVRCLLISTLFQLGRDAEGLKEAELTVQEDPRLVDGKLNLCLALTRQRRIEEALAQAKMALELAPGNEEVYQKLLGLLLFQKQYVEAVRVGREALAIAPFNPWVRLFLGNALAQVGEEAEAARQLSLAVILKPEWSAQLPIVIDKPAVTRENSTSP